MDVSSSQVYANFRAWVPRNVIPVGTLHPVEWVYYDWGPRSYPEPLICLHGLAGSAESFFPQVTSLAPLGYRLVSVQLAEYWSVHDFCDAFHAFLDALGAGRVHLYGVGIGGFLAMNYLARRPERVVSVALTHSYLCTDGLALGTRYSPAILRWLPDFLVRRAVRDTLPRGPVERALAGAAEFEIRNTMSASRSELASRLALTGSNNSVVGRHRLAEDRITLIDSIDRARERDVEVAFETARFLPGAKRALLKGGGDFPYISAASEVNMHLIVHLRRNAATPAEMPAIPPPALLPKVWRHEPPRPAAATGSGSPISPSKSDPAGSEADETEERNGSQTSDGLGGEPEERRDADEIEHPENAPLLAQFLPERQNSYEQARHV